MTSRSPLSDERSQYDVTRQWQMLRTFAKCLHRQERGTNAVSVSALPAKNQYTVLLLYNAVPCPASSKL